MKKIVWCLVVVAACLAALAGYAWKYAAHQGLTDAELSSYTKAKIHRDQRGVYNIDGNTWSDLVEAQGFATAGERFFQMDLIRKKADGGLAELFGRSALDFDRGQRAQDWRYYAEVAYKNLPDSQRKTCDDYARGVNSFLSDYPKQIGVEYALLRTTPAPWTCVDSFLVVLVMADQMSQSWKRDLDLKVWHEMLPADWWSFLFTSQHPWNQPLFEDQAVTPVAGSLPTTAVLPLSPLAKSHLTPNDFKLEANTDTRNLDGSNSWAYRGKNGAWLANDPHLGYQVPQLWLPLRLSTADGWWVTGTTIPGVPSVLIGMNQNLAWSITNTAEDVDDAVIEQENTNNADGTEKLEPTITSVLREIKIKGEPSEFLAVRKSPRGPIVRDLGHGRLVARQWIALKPGILSLPGEALAHATNWESFNAAVDDFKFVPLNFTMLDRVGNMGLRISGCDITRVNDESYAQELPAAGWLSAYGAEQRRRLFYPFDNGSESVFIGTANQQLWRSNHIHNWSDDDRAARIKSQLSLSSELKKEDMRLLQLDTTSLFHKNLLNWLLKNGRTSYLPSPQKVQWTTWDGDAKTCPLCMSEADDGLIIFDKIMMKTIAQAFNKSGDLAPSVHREMRRALVLKAIEIPTTLSALGLDPNELATGLIQSLARVDARNTQPWQERNHSTAQHPFVHRIPVIGGLFKIGEPPQFGSSATLRSEKPMHGPSMRILWQPSAPEESLWAFPTGTSGHVLSPHYNDWSKNWQSGGMVLVPNAR